MRVVIAPFNRMQPSTLEAVRAAGHEVVCTGQEVTSYEEIASQLPAGWKPDVFLFWSLEYHPVPRGVENADCFTVGVVGDWNLGGQAVQQIGLACDLLIADANGCDRLRALGFENVAAAPLWSYDPALHRRLPNARRDLDILMIGNFNHDIQRERSKWLARVACLSSRWRVCLTSGVQGEAYVELMNRAKIVFNRSIRGEINMRAYEAPACGALHFYERENREIGTLYTDLRDIVLYGKEDLEELLEYYLTHEDERVAIAEAGWQRVQSETPSAHLRRLFHIIESRICARQEAGGPRRPARIHAQAIVNQQPTDNTLMELRRVRQWLLTSDRSFLVEAEQALLRAERCGADPGTVAKLRGSLLARAGEYSHGPERQSVWNQAREQWHTALAIDSGCAVTNLNLAHLMLETGEPVPAEQYALAAYSCLKDAKRVPFLPGDLHWPRRFDAFEVELERIEGHCVQGTEEWSAGLRQLLLWRACDLLSDLAFSQCRFRLAADFAREAVAQISDIGLGHYRSARALRALGQAEEAISAYGRALQCAPFLIEARHELPALLIDLERPVDALAILQEWRKIIAGCPVYRSCIPECERLVSLARAREQEISQEKTPGPRRLLAFPDWCAPTHWQGIIRAFVERADPAPALLMLWADPVHFPDTERLLREIETFLTVTLRLSPSALPDITLMAEPLRPEDRWKLFYLADALAGSSEPPDEFMEPYQASRLNGQTSRV